MKILITFLLCLSQAYAFEVSLDRTDEILENEISGIVTVRCGARSQIHNCYASGLVGGNLSKIYVKNGTIDADYVKVQRVGSRYIKGSKFYSKSGKSKNSFNLWIRSAFQRPLLTRGENIITYKFFKNKELVHSGELRIDVSQGESRDCGWGTRTIFNGQCPQQYLACSDYFRSRNYCR